MATGTEARQQLEDWVVLHLHVDNQGGTTVSKTDLETKGSSAGKENLKTSDCINLWELWQWEKLAVSQENLFERPRWS